MPRSRRAFPSGAARGPDYISQQAPPPEEYITQAAPRRPSAHAPPRAGLLLPDGWLRRVLAMESYDVIANQPVVIDNVSAGGRASRGLGGREGPAGRDPFVIGDGRAPPATPPLPSPRRPSRRLGPRTAPYAASSRAAAGAGPPRFGAPRLAEVPAGHPPQGRCPSLAGSGPRRRGGARCLGGARRRHWLGRLPVSGGARRYLPKRGASRPAVAESTCAHWQLELSVRRGCTPLCAWGTMAAGGPGLGQSPSMLWGQALAGPPACSGGVRSSLLDHASHDTLQPTSPSQAAP